MCERCETIGYQLLNYRHALESINDTLALTLLAEVIADLEAEKASLHPANDKATE
jgi:hypothetical protein